MKEHLFGALFMICGAAIVLLPNVRSFHLGDMLILLASAIAPLGNFASQRARKKVASEIILVVRSVITAFVIFVLAIALGNSSSFPAMQTSLIFFFINGFFLLGLTKLLWTDGIHRISVTKANALECSITPLVTLIFAWMILQQPPTPWQLLSLIPICAGVILLSKKTRAEPIIESQ